MVLNSQGFFTNKDNMDNTDTSILFAKLLVLESKIDWAKSIFETYKVDHEKDAQGRTRILSEKLDVIFDKYDEQCVRCFSHAPILASFQQHIKDEEKIIDFHKDKKWQIFIGIVIAFVSVSLTLIIEVLTK